METFPAFALPAARDWQRLMPALFGQPLIGLWAWLATRYGLASTRCASASPAPPGVAG